MLSRSEFIRRVEAILSERRDQIRRFTRWALAGTVTGDGGPEVDPDGLAIVFNAANLSVNNPFVFHYTVNVPAGESGARILSGVAEYQLDGMANPVPSSSSPPLALADVSASQAAVGYTQYFTDVPALLVGVHIAGATALWISVLTFHLGLFAWRSEPVLVGARAPVRVERDAAVTAS